MSVRRAQAEIDSKEFVEWQAFARLEPFGAAEDDLRFARLASLFANIHRNPKNSPSHFTPDDFMPEYDADYLEEGEALSADDTLALVQGLAARFGGDLRPMTD
jgi:hypothetical protein